MKNPRLRPRLSLGALLLAGAAGLWFLRLDKSLSPGGVTPATRTEAQVALDGTGRPESTPTFATPAAGLSDVGGDAGETPAVAAALARRERMLGLMRSDPARALAEAVSVSDYAALPDELRPHYERPFHALADLEVLPVCAGDHETATGAGDHRQLVLHLEGVAYEATAADERRGAFSRKAAPLHGIVLGDRAVVADGPLAILSAEDAALLSALPLGQPDASRDFATGAPLGPAPVVAVAGDRRLLFADLATAQAFNQRLAALDTRPGPHAGSRAVLALPYSTDPSAGFDWAAAEAYVADAASAWTETPKSSFFIRADFPDVAGSLEQATLAGLINTRVVSAIEAMAYGKTTVSAEVSAEIVRLPQNSTAYTTDSGLLHDDAVAAYKALHGADALDGYDIIGVQFPSIGASSGGIVYAGLASVGGSRHWLQGSPSEKTVVHEFGHNYGLGHSNFWQTSDGDPVSATGANLEYGDPFDVMGSGDSPEAHFHMQGKALLNWLDTSRWVDANVAGAGTYRLHRFDAPATTGALRGLRVIKDPAAGAAAVGYYWAGYRPGIGDNARLRNGAYLLWERPSNNRSWLLDTTPGSTLGREDAALRVGLTYSDATAGVHLTPLGIGGSGADAWLDLHVELGNFPGNRAPSASFSPPPTASARTPRTLSVTAVDPDGDTLAYGWDFGDASATINSASVTQSWTVGGSYPVSIVVSDRKGGTVTRSATITVTDPLLGWTPAAVAAGRGLRAVSTLRGRHLVGESRYLYSSLDRATWDRHDTGLVNYRAAAFAATESAFVAVGRDYDSALSRWVGTIHRSTDGRLWQRVRPPAVVAELRSVAAAPGGILVAVGHAGALLRSDDHGASWTPLSVAAAVGVNLQGIAYGDGLFMTVGDTTVLTSPDGLAWAERPSPVLASWHSFRTVLHAQGAWYAGGWYSGVHRSTDGGVTWTRAAINSPDDHTLSGLAAGPGVLLASAFNQDTDSDTLLVSTDGLVWQPAPGPAPFPLTDSLAYAEGAFVSATGTSGELLRSDAFFPDNQVPSVSAIRSAPAAEARRKVAFTASAADADGDPLTWLWDFGDGSGYAEGAIVSHLFVSGGDYTVKLHVSDGRGGIRTVTRAITVTEPLAAWTQAASGTTANLRDVVGDGAGKLVAVGAGGGTHRVSTDGGATWPAGGTLGINITLRGVCHGGGRFVAVGSDYDFGISAWVGVIYTSPDGLAWTRRQRSGPELRDVVFGDGRYVAVGDAGTILVSTDAITWNPASSGTTNNLQGIAHGQGAYVIAGANASSVNGTVLTSTNAEDWLNTSAGLGTSQGLFEIAHTGDRFLVSGFYASIRHSTDGGASFATTLSGQPRAEGFARIHGLTLAVARDLDNGNADQDLVSLDGATWAALPTSDTATRNAVIAVGDRFLSVGDAGEIRLSGPVASSQSGYADWSDARFAAQPALGGPELDPDGDGLANLIEYAAGTDPLSAASRPELVAETLAGELTLSLALAPGVSDVVVRFESSDDLATWSENGVITLENAGEWIGAVSADVPRRFLRARLVLAD